MVVFGLLCEGVRDQAVIEQVLLGYFADQPGQPDIRPVFPPEVARKADEVGGWTVLKGLLLAGQHRKALQFVDYLVVHVDTDVCEDLGFDVPRERDPDALRSAVIARVSGWLGDDFMASHGDRVIFAIAVDGIECWLLPLLETRSAKQGKTTGCLGAANEALKRVGRHALKNSPDGPVRPYRDAASPYRKQKTLRKLGPKNPSLAAFLADLDARAIEIPADDEDDGDAG